MIDTLPFANGTFQCPVRLYPCARATRTLIVLPALGVTARKYDALANALVAADCNVLVADWPGQGESLPRPDRRHDYGYRQLVEDFVPALLVMAQRHFPGSPAVLFGHSLGGHIATLYAAAHPGSAVRVIGVACGNIHYRHWQGRQRLMTPSVALVFNLLVSVLGYLPGKRIGFGGHEARTLMRDWGRVAFTGHYRHLGLPQAPAASNGVASLFVQIDGDHFAPPASTLGLAELIQAHPQIERLPSPRPPHENPHSAWLKTPQGVVDCVIAWLAQPLPARLRTTAAG